MTYNYKIITIMQFEIFDIGQSVFYQFNSHKLK